MKLSRENEALLYEIFTADNPQDYLRKLFNDCTRQQDAEIRSRLRNLIRDGFISIMWADNIPWHVTINSETADYFDELVPKRNICSKADGGIIIGNNNLIRNSHIGNKVSRSEEKLTFYNRHPILCSILISFGVGLLLMFSFWDTIIAFIERFF